MARGLEDVRTLRNLDGTSPEADDAAAATDPDANPPKTTSSINPEQHATRWATVPVYVIGERFARGLDLPDVRYVTMLSPPSSAAGYAHMAGRTGRRGRAGTAITLVRPRDGEVRRLAAIADALGLKFTGSISGAAAAGRGSGESDEVEADDGGKEDDGHDEVREDFVVAKLEREADTSTTTSYPWRTLSESALRRTAPCWDIKWAELLCPHPDLGPRRGIYTVVGASCQCRSSRGVPLESAASAKAKQPLAKRWPQRCRCQCRCQCRPDCSIADKAW